MAAQYVVVALKVENIHSGWLSSGKLVAPKEDNIHCYNCVGVFFQKFQRKGLTNMITSAILKQASKQAERCYNYVAPQFCHAQFHTVKSGALMPAGNCAAGSAFLY